MNDPRDSDHGHDFGDDKLSAIYRQSRIEEPPMKLDSAILREARDSVESNPKAKKWWRLSGILEISAVSVLVLAVSIGLLNKSMVEKQEVIVEPAADSIPMEDRLESKPQRLPEQMPEGGKDAGAARPEIKALGNATRQSAPAPTSAPVSSPRTSGMATPAPVQTLEKEAAPATAPATAPTAAPAMKRKAAPAEKMELRSREAVMPAPAPQQFNEEMATETDSAEPKAADAVLAPEAWLQKIRQLKAAGKAEEAARELELFSKAYPDYELPEGLK